MPTVFLALGAPYARSMYSRARAGACTRVACTPKSLEASCPAGDVRGGHCRQQVEAMGQSLVAGTGAQRRLGREGRPHDCSRCMTAVCLIALQMVAYICRACCCVYVCARTHVCVCKGVRACEHVCVCVCVGVHARVRMRMSMRATGCTAPTADGRALAWRRDLGGICRRHTPSPGGGYCGGAEATGLRRNALLPALQGVPAVTGVGVACRQ